MASWEISFHFLQPMISRMVCWWHHSEQRRCSGKFLVLTHECYNTQWPQCFIDIEQMLHLKLPQSSVLLLLERFNLIGREFYSSNNARKLECSCSTSSISSVTSKIYLLLQVGALSRSFFVGFEDASTGCFWWYLGRWTSASSIGWQDGNNWSNISSSTLFLNHIRIVDGNVPATCSCNCNFCVLVCSVCFA